MPRPTRAARDAEARWTILLLGGLTGLVLMLAGAMFFAYYFGTLVEWIDRKTPPAGAYKVLLALIAFVGGAGLVFFSVQPARADERDNPFLRRLVYGANVGLVSLLLVAGLLALNVLVALKVPSRLDTTATGLYSVSDTTKQYLAGLTTPVKIYATFDPEDGVTTTTLEMQRLLDAMREANPAQVTVERLSLQASEGTIRELVAKFPQAREFNSDLGVLIVANPASEKPQTSFVRSSELVERGDAPGGAPKFVGESRLIKEILFLAEDKTKPKVYFTAGHGELALPDAGRRVRGAAGGRRRALKTAVLEGANAEALVYDASATAGAVPADASIVVIADPQTAALGNRSRGAAGVRAARHATGQADRAEPGRRRGPTARAWRMSASPRSWPTWASHWATATCATSRRPRGAWPSPTWWPYAAEEALQGRATRSRGG